MQNGKAICTASEQFSKKNDKYLEIPKKPSIFAFHKRGISSVGRAFEWHSKGQEFDSPMLHKNPSQISLRGIFRIECDKKCDK